MIQKNYKLTMPSDFGMLTEWDEAEKVLAEIRQNPLYETSSCVYLRLVTLKVPMAVADKIVSRIKECLPKAKIAGMSLSAFGLPPEEPCRLQINCMFFASSDVTILEFVGCPKCYITVGKLLGQQLESISDVKGAEIICAGVDVNVATFVDNITKDSPDIPFFGAMAGAFEIDYEKYAVHTLYEQSTKPCQYAIGKGVYTEGIVLVIFSGEDLHVKVDSVLGWKPLGKELRITKLDDPRCIARLDDMPAAHIYRHYLHVEPDKNFLNNVCEFPLLVQRNDYLIARVPPHYDESGRLYFGGDFRPGEKVRLGYANPAELLQGTKDKAEEMRRFGPQGCLLTICGNRDYFLGHDDAAREVDAYLSFMPDLIISKGECEIYHWRGQGGVLNSALVAAGLREGERSSSLLDETSTAETEDSSSIPLTTRMAAFLEVTTDELKQAVKEAKQANLAKSRFLSNMSHEIRTPINAILGMDEMILRECQDPVIREYAQNILNAGNNLLSLVNDILDFSKIEAGKMEIIPVEYALSSVLNDLTNMVEQRATKKGLKLTVKADPKLPGMLIGDEIRLKQVVTNILTNAVKYTQNGGITLEIDYERIDDNNITLKFAVTDTGIGIKEEDIQKLFSAFERIEEKRNRTIEGTGLGMNITERLLTLMGSRLEVASVYGEGSTFSFKLRQQVVNWEPIGDFAETYRKSLANKKAYREKFTAPEAKILVVDDTVMNLTVVKGLLKQTQVQIDTADSGYEALKMVQDKTYDLIFLDHRMPGIDGIETLARLKQMTGNPNLDTPVISLTANAVSGARAEYMAAGFNDYLTKPIHSDKLETMMMKYLPPEKLHIVKEEAVTAEGETADEMAAMEEEAEFLPTWLKELEFLNTAAGIKFCGSAEGYLDALMIFADAAEAGANEIEDYLKAHNIADYTVKVHALKSSARIIGAAELSERAKRLESAGNAGYWEEIETGTPYLLTLYRICAQKLSPLLKTTTSKNKAPITEEELAEAYESMQEMAASFDYDSLNFILRDLGEYALPEAEKTRYQALKQAAGKPDWDKVNELLQRG